MNNIKHIRRRSNGTFILLLILFCFIFTPALLFSDLDFGSGSKKPDGINLSTNYLFKGTYYLFNLDDFYDDTNLYKIYTGAKFQTEMFNGTTLEWTGVVNNDTVTPVDNDEIQYGESSGVYNGTYDFRDELGETDLDIDFVDHIIGTAEIISEYQGHKKVLNFTHDAANSMQNYLPVYQASGTIEFYLKEVLSRTYFRIRDIGGALLFEIMSYPTYVKVYYGDGAGGNTYSANYFFTTDFPHFKIEFDCATDTFSVWCENFLMVEDVNFKDNLDLTEVYQVRTYNSGASDFYLDAVGYSWDPEYTPSGHHTGTYSFTDDTIGGNPEGWSITETGGTVNIIAERDGHKKVLEFYDDDPTYRVDATNTFAIQTDSTIEFWWAYSATETLNHYFLMQFKEGANTRFYLCLNYLWNRLGSIQYRDSTGYHPTGYYDNPINTMIHIKLIFDDTNNSAEFIVNSISYGELPYFSNSTVGIDNWFMFTRTVNGGGPYWHWIDAIGYSCDTYYTVGDNLYPSLGNTCPDNINMIKGSYDYTDNMKVNDDTSTNFTSSHTDGYIHEMPDQWDNFTFTEGTGDTIGDIEIIDADYSTLISTENIIVSDEFIASFAYTNGYYKEGSVANTWVDDSALYWIYDKYTTPHLINVEFVFDEALAGRDFYISSNIVNAGGSTSELRINDVMWKSGLTFHFDDELAENVNKISIYVYHATSIVNSKIYFFKIVEDLEATPAELDVQVDIQITDPDLSSIDFFKYSHKTNVSVTMDLDIWNWDTSTWFEIESIDNSADFNDDSFTLGSGSDYVSGTFQVRIQFQASSSSSDFELLIDRLRLDYLTIPAELEMTITFTFAQYNEDLLAMTIQSWQKMNISQMINFSIWNYDIELYVQISSSSETTFTKKEYNTTSPNNFISSNGIVKLYWISSNSTNNFELHIDYLFIQIFYKLNLVHEKSFDTNGIYRYRWCIIGSIYYTQWVNFEVIDPIPNFHAISESDNPTRWILQGAGISPTMNFSDDIDPSSDWDLYDVSPVDFNKYIPDLVDYLLDNYVFYGSSYISPAQWGDFAFTKGAGNTVGELETNDADEAIIDAGYIVSGSETFLGYMVPDDDIYTQWNEGDGTPHYLKLDEAKGDMDGDGGNIRETTSGVEDVWDFTSKTIPAGRMVSKLVVAFYMKIAVAEQTTVLWYETSTGQSDYVIGELAYSWKTKTHSGLSISQAQLDGFWMSVYPYMFEGVPRFIDIETVYVDVYTSLIQYSVDYTMTWDVDEPESMDNFSYDYRTTFAVDTDLDIYNWDTTGWLELQSNTDVNWHTGSYILTDPYISGSDEIKIRFQSALTTTNFDMELDQIAIEYNSIYTISKKHNNTIPGYIYMQTNTVELISLNSSVYGANYTLSSGEYFEIDFQTNSDSQINLVLLRDGVINKTLILSQSGNTNFNRHTVQISVDEDVEFDQLRFSSTFEDKDYFRCYDIKTYNYILTGDYADFRVGSKNDYEIYLTPDDYNLKIYDPYDGEVTVNTNITISSTYDWYMYEPAETIQCRISLFNPNGDYLQFEDYHIFINRSLSDIYFRYELVDILFFADVETNVYIEVYDRFDASLNNFTRTSSSYIDLEIDVFKLQIKSLLVEATTLDINTTYTYPLLSGDSLYFMLVEDYYQIGYYDEQGTYNQFLIYLDENKAYQLNSSLKTIYFSMFTYDGLGINHDLVRFYINSERKDFGFNSMLEDTLELIILDFFNNTLANETIDANAYDNSEYNLFVEIYSLIILNQFTYEDIIVNISQVGSGIWMTQIIPKQFGLSYRFLPNVEYNITIYFTNTTLYTSRIVNLTTNSHIESFGEPTMPEEYPKDVYFGVYTTTGLGIDHDLLRFYIDGNRTDFGFNRIENMIINITVMDFFNTTLFTNPTFNTSGIYEYDILITLFSLKIKNEARETSNYTLKLGGLETIGLILPEEIVEYQLATNNYVFEFTNNEDDSFHIININLNENKVYIINSTYYTAYFGLFDQYDHRLDNSLFSLYLNGTRKDFGFIELSSEYYNITVYDWLNIPVFDQIIYLFNYTEYNIYITVFELHIRHLAQENSNFSLYETTSGNYINFSMAPDTINSYMLSSSTYNITWINGENLQISYYYITLDSNYILTLSSTYHGVYFALFTYDGLGIDHNLVKFYINESRKDFGFNIMTSASAEIVVLDFFNNTLFNQTIDFSSLSEYNIFIEIYSLIILNQFTYEDIITNITQVGSGIWLNHIIPKQFALSCRFAPNMNYTIDVYYVNNSLYITRTIDLAENNHIESFGTPTFPSEYPKDIYFSVYTGTGLAIDQLLLKFYIDGDRADFGFNTIESVMVSVVVKDFFNTTLFNQNINTTGIYEYDILITLYSLKVKNEARLTANYTLRLGGLTETGNILPGEIIEYQLSSNNYVFDYTNNEDNSFHTINVNLNQDRVYILNSTYYNIYFSLYDVNLHIFHPYQYEFRLNGTIQNFGFIYDLQTDDYSITVTDRFGTYLFDNIINLRGLNEYRIDITLYELQIRHLATENSDLILTEDVSGNDYSLIMTPNSVKSIVIGSADYTLNWTNGENNRISLISIALTEDRVIMLNTSYYNIYFSLYDVNLHTIDPHQYVFRLNGTIQDFGFIYDLQTDDYSITVTDRFGISLFNNIINLRGLNEYRIEISLFELQIRHLATENSDLILTEDISGSDYLFIMTPDSIKSIIIGSADYTLNWTNGENNRISLISIALTEDRVIMLNTSYYDIYFSLYDVNLHTFYSTQYEFRLNNTIQDLGLIEDLQSDNYNITVKDRFGTYLFNNIINLRGLNEYRIEISLFELQIRHLAEENSNLTLIETILNNTYSFIMTPDSIKSILMGSSNYTLNWTNGENNQLTMFSINLIEDTVIKLNTTYFEVYFSLFTYDGFGVNHDFVRFYINGLRKDFGFNTLKQDTNNLKVLDYFNATLFNSNIDLRQFTEYNIYVEIYTMIIFNNYSHPIKIKIERNDIEFEQVIEAQFGMPYRMLPKVEYIVSTYYLNGTLLEEREVELDKNNKIVPFGFYEEEVPEYPSFDNTTITITLIILIFIGVIGLTTYFVYKYNKRVQNLKVAYARQHTIEKDLIEGVSGRSSRFKRIK